MSEDNSPYQRIEGIQMFIDVFDEEGILVMINANQIESVNDKGNNGCMITFTSGRIINSHSSYDELHYRLEELGLYLFPADETEDGYIPAPDSTPEHD
ncbi:hypothetical protein [Neobacillus cucumis]|uniref:hypothetical protein n=1 Tax=Neobacillus cucumis TaxID=1740721 RepID=UPI0019624F6D|nr:hypothetical protein [Neobacillus cucumis]MBM7651371.1 competence transcription factor ComK [Neobacillus cucumis]